MIDFDAYYEALRRRDSALDGMVFVAVKTTGIYCRPVCRVRTPFVRNVEFYPSAAAAERAGYRPCLRCRPETAPFCPAWKGTRTTVERALTLIEAGALDGRTLDALAERLGIGPRHLSRLFAEHLHASPLQVAQSLRIQRAKRLLDETDLPVTLIAEHAGFASARRMSAAFAHLYGRPPSALRRKLGRRQPGCSSRRESNDREDRMQPTYDTDPDREVQVLPSAREADMTAAVPVIQGRRTSASEDPDCDKRSAGKGRRRVTALARG